MEIFGGNRYDFYPRPPRGGRRLLSAGWLNYSNFYPRPPRGGRPWPLGKFGVAQLISIHALREEGDSNEHPNLLCAVLFLSTPSARRATCHRQVLRKGHDDFYPRPPRGGRQKRRTEHACNKKFLSTPSARRATPAQKRRPHPGGYFYPRPPRGGRRTAPASKAPTI